MGSTIGALHIGDGSGWTFLNGIWQDGPDGELGPADGTRVEYLAIREHELHGDFTASFRFRLRNITPVRFLFRLQDTPERLLPPLWLREVKRSGVIRGRS